MATEVTVWIERGATAANWTLNVLCRITAGSHFVCDSIYVLLSRQSKKRNTIKRTQIGVNEKKIIFFVQ